MAEFYSQITSSKSLQITFEGVDYSFSQLFKELEKVESQLNKLSLRRGQMIYFKSKNHLMHLILFLVCEKMELIFVPAFHENSHQETELQIRNLKPEWIATLAGDGQLKIHAFSLNSVLQEKTSGCLFQTSGTTGIPGFILQSFENLLRNAQIASAGQKISLSSKVLSLLPFSHVGGLAMQTTAVLMQGAHLFLEDKNQVQKVCETLKQASHGIIVPSYFYLLKCHRFFQSTTYDHSPLIVTGSTVVTNTMLQDLESKGFQFQSVYGLTEIGPYVCTAKSPAKLPPDSLSHLGRPEFPYKMQINPMTQEIQILGPCVGRRLNLENGALESLLNKEGFLETGDLGSISNQSFFFQGRAKNLIVVGGYKVNPFEIEQKIFEIPSVQKCAVIGRPHPTLGEIAIAYVVGDSNEKAKIFYHLKKTLSRHKVPRQINFVSTLPETSIGKNHLHQIRQRTADEAID